MMVFGEAAFQTLKPFEFSLEESAPSRVGILNISCTPFNCVVMKLNSVFTKA